jgi:hypothetical protein
VQTALSHFTSPSFWACYRKLPAASQKAADKSFGLLKQDPHHPSLHFKKVGRYWSVRASLSYCALGAEIPGGILWFWIGSHAEYDKLTS